MRNSPDHNLLNVGTGQDASISEIAETIMDVVGFKGSVSFDQSRPDGTPRKLLNISKMKNLGWTASTDLKSGIEITYKHFKESLV